MFVYRHLGICALVALALAGGAAAGSAQPSTVIPPAARLGSPADGITVSAAGFASAPADSATVTFSLYSQKTPITSTMLAPIVDALIAAGADRNSISSPILMASAAAVPASEMRDTTLSATLNSPSAQSIAAAVP